MHRNAFTLLEVLLALALAAAVLAVMTAVVGAQLRLFDAGRREVEEAQLARALLRRIADDLRSVVPDPSESLPVGTLVGTSQELQATIRRAPQAPRATTGAAGTPVPPDRPNDLWIVNYYLADRQFPARLTGTPSGTSGGAADRAAEGDRTADRLGGLVCSIRDYATTAWTEEQGELDDWRRAAPVLAPEVEAIEFVYFQDGTAQKEWDSSRVGQLPSAVRIALTIRRFNRTRNSLIGATAGEERTPAVYSLLVCLPGVGPASEPQDAEPQDASSEPSESSTE